MPVTISVAGDTKTMAADLKRIRNAIPRITAGSVNKLTTYARAEVISTVASELKLPKSTISQTVRDRAPVPRFRLIRARTGNPISYIFAVSEGIQVTDIAGAWIGRKPGQKGGVKAKGGRFYRGAFKAPKDGVVRVWRRMGGSRLPIFLPRIGVNNRMLAAFEEKVAGPQGSLYYKRVFNLAADQELTKIGLR